MTCYDVHVIGVYMYVHMLILKENKRTEKNIAIQKGNFITLKMCNRIYSEQKSVKNNKTCSCFEHILLNYSKGSETSSGNLLVPLLIYNKMSCKLWENDTIEKHWKQL